MRKEKRQKEKGGKREREGQKKKFSLQFNQITGALTIKNLKRCTDTVE